MELGIFFFCLPIELIFTLFLFLLIFGSVGALMPCPFTGLKIFWAGPHFFCRTKNLFTHCARHKHFVPDEKMISIQ